MICDKPWKEFVEVLSTSEDTFAVSGLAFSKVADVYHIGKVDFEFQVGDSPLTPGGEELNRVLFLQGASSVGQEHLSRTFSTGEKGECILRLWNLSGEASWSREEREDLDVILQVLFFHLGRSRLIQRAHQNSMTDYMTGLPNADGYMKVANAMFQNRELYEYNAYYFNLKGFSLVNRKFGQKETDEIIKRYGKALEDFAHEGEVVGRLGGDNFVALIRREHTGDFLNLLSGVELYGQVGEEKVPVVVKAVAGILEIDDTLENCEPVISKCAAALSVAKNVVKKPYVFATKELEERIYRQKQIAHRFPAALQGEEFVVYYQPKVETDSYRLVGAEALVRWVCDDQIMYPGSFIPVIERDMSICQLDFYMLEHVCRDIQEWISKGLEPVRVSVNFSRKHLSNPALCEEILAMLEKYQVPSRYIEIEVTETTDEEEQGMLGAFLAQMREHNIATAIDDFGTGYSSLNMLRSFPVNVLKIDKSFINDSSITENDSIVLTNIVRMARELHVDVITEGVERWKQVEFLRQIQCNMVQGFLFDQPMPKESFEAKIRDKQYDITSVHDFSYNSHPHRLASFPSFSGRTCPPTT